jgi:hypothetical protein
MNHATATGTPAPDTTPRPDLTELSQWDAMPIEWLWQPYVPRAMLTVLSGAPGAGKTFVALAIAAEVTTIAGNVLYLSAGDHPARVLRPRFSALGGDPLRLHLLRGFLAGECWTTDLTDLSLLDRVIAQVHADLVVVDPLQSYLPAPSTGPDGRNPPGRGVLDRLSRLAENHDCGVLLVRNLNPRRPARAPALEPARSELLAGCSPADPAQRALLHVRSNCGPTGPARGFRIGDDGALHWTERCALSPADLLAPEFEPEEKSALEAAMAFLRVELAREPSPVTSVRCHARDQGIRDRTLDRAKRRLGVVSTKPGGMGWEWALPH